MMEFNMSIQMNQQVQILKKQRSLLFIEGLLFFLLGCFAIAAPFYFTMALDYIYGAVFVVGGLIQLVRSVKTRGIKGGMPSLFWSILTIVAGCIMLVNPMAGIMALTIILAFYFILEGLFKCAIYSHLSKMDKSFWLIVSAIISIALGMMILLSLPTAAFWVLGLFIGIDLIFMGCLLMGFSRRLAKRS